MYFDCNNDILRIYFCGSLSGCGEVGGLAGDDETGDVFYLLRFSNGTTSLYALNQDIRTPYFIASSQNFPMFVFNFNYCSKYQQLRHIDLVSATF